MKPGLVLLALFALVGCGTSHATAARDIDRFAALVQHEIPDLPNVGMAVVADGKVVYLRNATTAYYIGSTTKAYTGLATAILAQRGAIDLDAPVRKYLPASNTGVTLRAFLTHTSNIENGPIVFRTAYTGEHTHDRLVALLSRSKPRSKPGFAYDNLGYVVASLVIEEVTGKPWQRALAELVFEPLGMRHTTAVMSEAKRWGSLAQPYARSRAGDVVPLDFEKTDETMHAAGGIVTTPADLARWLEANLAHGRVDGRQAVPAAAVDEALKPQVPGPLKAGDFDGARYAFGWWDGTFHGEHVLFHGGGYEGWHSWYALLPERRIGAAALTNINGAMSEGADLIVSYALDRLLDKPAIEADYVKRLATLKERVANGRRNFIEAVAARAQRPWSLTHPNAAYAGRYEHPELGTLTIEERDGKLYASIGRLRGLIEAFTRPETARVELTPGTGEPLVFQWSNGDEPDAVILDQDVFTRTR